MWRGARNSALSSDISKRALWFVQRAMSSRDRHIQRLDFMCECRINDKSLFSDNVYASSRRGIALALEWSWATFELDANRFHWRQRCTVR